MRLEYTKWIDVEVANSVISDLSLFDGGFHSQEILLNLG